MLFSRSHRRPRNGNNLAAARRNGAHQGRVAGLGINELAARRAEKRKVKAKHFQQLADEYLFGRDIFQLRDLGPEFVALIGSLI